MKSKVKFLLAMCYLQFVIGENNQIKYIACAINEFVEHSFAISFEEFDIFMIGENSYDLKDLVDKVISLRASTESMKLFAITPYLSNEKFRVNRSAILLFDSKKSWSFFNQNARPTTSTAQMTFLVFCLNLQQEMIDSTAKENYKVMRFQSVLTIEDSSHFSLWNYLMFESDLCKKLTVRKVNEFEVKNLKWKTSIFVLKPIRDFNKCELSFLLPFPSHPSVQCKISNNGSNFKCYGYTMSIIECLTRQLNISAIYNPFDIGLQKHFNQSLNVTDHVVFNLDLNALYRDNFRYLLTTPYISKAWTFLVPPGLLFSPFEKLFLPFDGEFWIFFVVTGFVAVGIINAAKLLPPFLRNLLFGDRQTSPTLNLLIAFFGISQRILPSGNFARMLLMTFILFCLVVRLVTVKFSEHNGNTLFQNGLSREAF